MPVLEHDSSISAFLAAEIKGLYHHAQLLRDRVLLTFFPAGLNLQLFSFHQIARIRGLSHCTQPFKSIFIGYTEKFINNEGLKICPYSLISSWNYEHSPQEERDEYIYLQSISHSITGLTITNHKAYEYML
jgi:hypothetical protein